MKMSKLHLPFSFRRRFSAKKHDEKRNFNAIINKNTPFTIKEAYKTLRTNILFATRAKGCKKYVITSSVPGEGKTTNAINLAISFAQTEKRVLLVDSDLRKPRIHRYFKLDNKVGLSNYLSDIFEEETAKIFVQKTEYENLDVVTSGHIPPNPIELLASDGMKNFIKEMEEKYDFIIFDTPPINIVSDALVLSELVTGYIVVARCKYTEYDSVKYSLSKFELANIKPLGVILNSYSTKNSSYSYRSKYKYGYDRYYYSYRNTEED